MSPSQETPRDAPEVRIQLLVEVTAETPTAGPEIAEAIRARLETLTADTPGARTPSVALLGAPRSAESIRALFDLGTRQLVIDHSPVRLTPREAAVLVHLLRRPHEAVSRDELRDALDDTEGTLGPRAVDVILSRLRAKLPLIPPPVATVRGVGYRYEPSPQLLVLGASDQVRVSAEATSAVDGT